MKLYISADMEGTAGVCSWKQCDPSDAHEYPVYRRYMSREVRAAIEGAREAGVKAVTVNDSHWDMRNLLFDELPGDDDLRVISGTRKPLSMGQGLDASFGAAFFTGYHAAAGEAAALAHTYSSDVYRVSVNGIACSEALLHAAFAGSCGVPVVLVTGDDAIVRETLASLPWAVGVPVKRSIGYTAVDSLTPKAAQEEIRAGAKDAIRLIERAKPFTFEAPFELSIETLNVENADYIELMPQFERTGGRSVRFISNDYPTMLRAFIVATRISAGANAVV
ncbi:MAG TPA: M55 family metallopeptidase [Candidatus Acidoferrales bacterium]|nr:M55 family metallopeptidase [Candidatus Acidoferrales bacterium]